MQALTIVPGRAGSLQLGQVGEPPAEQGSVLVRTLAVGVCGTDRELIEGEYGQAPAGRERLVLGHESLGRVVQAPEHSGFSTGDTVVGIVRHPDPVPCINCALGEWDMCRNGLYTERGIKQADGFAAQRWRAQPEFLVKVSPSLGVAGVLLEPASVIAKAWEHVERIGGRARWAPKRILVTGAGAVGLMAALLGLQRELEVHLFDHNDSGPKPALARGLGARYHTEYPASEFDIVIECTGAPSVIAQALAGCAPGGIVCLTGLGGGHSTARFDAAALERAERAWLERLITTRVPVGDWEEAYEKRENDVKTVILFEN